ncbi:MAG: preprotein translocase subunit SecE [Prevotella sp.]|nr:preprotein translocase subunit SecE [Prevotella sp.]MBR6591191.1 preprotein translocase subunit SecE [Prevotella sp.]
MFKKFVNYCKACYEELRFKTTWPSRSELTANAALVLTASLVIALAVWAIDSLFKAFMSYVIYPN